MKKNLMFFALGVSTTLLMGAGISYWNEIRQENKYGVVIDSFYGSVIDSLGALRNVSVPNENRYGVVIDSFYGSVIDSLGASRNVSVPNENRYALVWDREIGNNAKKAMVVGFIHGMAVGRKKAEEGAKTKSPTPNRAWGF